MTRVYRPCVGVMLLNAEGRAFIGRRKPKNDADAARAPFEWQMPQGGIDPGEEPYAAALRELYEETNVSRVEFIAEAPHWLSYDLPVESTMRWKGQYVGQTQRWFALRFTGAEDEIDIHHPGGGHHKPEFDDWRWEDPAALPDLIVPFKRQVYVAVLAEFSSILKN